MRSRPDLHGFEAENEEHTRTREELKNTKEGKTSNTKITSKTHDGKSQLVPNPLGQLPILFSQVHLTLKIVCPLGQSKPSQPDPLQEEGLTSTKYKR